MQPHGCVNLGLVMLKRRLLERTAALMSQARLATWFTAVERLNVDGKVLADRHCRWFRILLSERVFQRDAV